MNINFWNKITIISIISTNISEALEVGSNKCNKSKNLLPYKKDVSKKLEKLQISNWQLSLF